MDVSELIAELFSRVHGHVHGVLDGLATEDLYAVPEPGSNPIGWLLWHLTRVQDMHIAEILEQDQVWQEPGWSAPLRPRPRPGQRGLRPLPRAGRGRAAREPEAIRDYYAEVEERTKTLVAALTAESLDRVVDTRWDPPVTLGVRLVSIADDDIQHAGQAAYVKGLLQRR